MDDLELFELTNQDQNSSIFWLPRVKVRQEMGCVDGTNTELI
ncbi:hypothetical protein [Candidatus Nitrospira neomarina]|uniref:Uncharacterized protein n=1 Tax=Candidatus Nitrospira neomarina TaxID=3020899 RepID=A0AA96GJD7_9BACT|nr:hypothetical protein [Candidatus Nitrospira neomarina]WNM62498.1 hypothetical protein PQG83_01770 [Candidatus Nitrospira neomarina]